MSTPPSESMQHGVSLTQDAWRRLKKSRPAMVALWTLVMVVVLAFFTPLLPLQPPDRDLTKKMFAEPQAWPLLEKTFEIQVEDRQTLAAEADTVLEDLREQRAQLKTASKRLGQADDEEATAEIAAELETLKQRFRTSMDAYNSLQQKIYTDAGFPKLDTLARWMVRTRYAVFGEWQVASICGRDKLGRDILSRIFWGARVSLIVGFVATLVSLVIGVSYGAISGYAGGWIDNLMMRIVDVLYSIPFVFLVIFIISVLSEDSVKDRLLSYGIDRITIFYLLVGAIYWLTMSRVVRGQVVSLRNEQYVEAAQSLGVSETAIVFPSLAIGTTLFALNFLGDGLRDAFDPRMKGR